MTDADLAALLAGKRDVAPWLLPVADVLAALRTGPSPAELAGEARALAEFRLRADAPVPGRHARCGTAGRTSRLSTKAAAGAATAAVLLGGAATAAFAGVLPAPIQQFAHDVIGAPGVPPASQHGPARGTPALPVPLESHGKHAASAKSHGKHAASAKPHSTDRHADGQPGTGQSQGEQGNGQGQQGNGQGSSHAKGRGGGPHDQGQPGGGQSQAQGNPHANGQHANPHSLGQQGNPHPSSKPAARHARPARHGPAMES